MTLRELIDEAKRRDAEATEGPWFQATVRPEEVRHRPKSFCIECGPSFDELSVALGSCPHGVQTNPIPPEPIFRAIEDGTLSDVYFVTSSRTSWPALAAKAEEMAGHLRHVTKCCRSMCGKCGDARRFLRAEEML